MKLDATKLPIKIRQTRRARIFYYLIIIALLAGAYFLGGWPAIALAALAAVLLIVAEISRLVNVIIIEQNKVTLSSGLLNVHTTTVYYSEITDIKITQSIWERLLNYGEIYVNTASHEEYELVEKNMPRPQLLRKFVDDLKHAYLASVGSRQP